MVIQTIEHPRGDSFSRTLRYLVNGTNTSLTGYTVFTTLKTGLDSDVTDADAILTGEYTGTLNTQLTWTPAEMLKPEGDYYFNVRIVNGAGSTVKSSSNVKFKITLGSTQRVA